MVWFHDRIRNHSKRGLFAGTAFLLSTIILIPFGLWLTRHKEVPVRNTSDAKQSGNGVNINEVSMPQGHDATREPAAKVKPPPPRKVPPPVSDSNSALKGPRLGIGPEAYKDIEDAQVGQWAIEESEKIEELAEEAMGREGSGLSLPPGPLPPAARQFFFNTAFSGCCTQDVKELRTEILRRLGPPAKDPEEISRWTMLFSSTEYPGAPGQVSPGMVRRYAPYLRRLGIQLRRRQIPRALPKTLSYSEAPGIPQPPSNFPYNIVVTINTNILTSAGYIIVDFDRYPGIISCDFVGSKLIVGSDALMADNDEVRKRAGEYEPPNYTLAIGKNPMTPDKPIHVFASGSKPVHVVKVTLFDE
jgi:hypothetical protein